MLLNNGALLRFMVTHQSVYRTAVRASGFVGVFQRNINPWMTVPKIGIRQRTMDRQVVFGDFYRGWLFAWFHDFIL